MKINYVLLIFSMIFLISKPLCASEFERPNSIGAAHMEKDGTIIVNISIVSDDGKSRGDAQFIYAIGDPEYNKVLKHLGGLKVGEEKSVYPWPNEKNLGKKNSKNKKERPDVEKK